MKTLSGCPTYAARPPRLILAAVAVLALLQAGCSYPKAVHTYEYLIDYDHLTDRFDPLVSLVHMPEGAKFSDYRIFVIGHIQVGENWVKDQNAARGYARSFRKLLQSELRGLRKFDDVTRDTDFRVPGGGVPMLRLDGKITMFDTGSGWRRYASGLLPFFQNAATDLQIEGRIVDASTDKLVMEFADRRRHLGNTAWGPNPRTFNDTFVMNLTVELTAECLAKFIHKAYNGLPAAQTADEAPDDDAQAPPQEQPTTTESAGE